MTLYYSVGISLSLRLFADDCVLYRIIKLDQGQNNFQLNLDLNNNDILATYLFLKLSLSVI